MSGLNISPPDTYEPLHLSRNHEELNHLVVDLVSHFPLPEFEIQISNAHQEDIYQKGHNRKRVVHLIVLVGVQDHAEQQDC